MLGNLAVLQSPEPPPISPCPILPLIYSPCGSPAHGAPGKEPFFTNLCGPKAPANTSRGDDFVPEVSFSRVQELTSWEANSSPDGWSGCSPGISLLLEILGPTGEAHLPQSLCRGKAEPTQGQPKFLRIWVLLCCVSIESEVFSKKFPPKFGRLKWLDLFQKYL